MPDSNKPLLDRLNAISEDEIKSIHGHHEKPRILYRSRSIKVTVYVGSSPVDFMIPFQRVDEAIDKATNLADGMGYEQALLDELRYARQLYNDQIEGRNAPRADHTGRRGIVVSMQYAAAWTYLLLSELDRYEIRNSFLHAETLVASLVPGWASYTRAQQLSLITAFLVDRCFRKQRLGELESPVENRTKDHNPQSYYITYIIPQLDWVKKRLVMNPHLFDFAKAEPLQPAPNAYLRQVFEVLSRLKENSQHASGTIKS
jgi:hypothetical protein